MNDGLINSITSRSETAPIFLTDFARLNDFSGQPKDAQSEPIPKLSHATTTCILGGRHQKSRFRRFV